MEFEVIKQHRPCKAGSFVVDYTPLGRSKSCTEKMLSAHIAARAGGKTQTAMLFWEDECSSSLKFLTKLFPRKQTKLLQSKSKQSRMVRVRLDYYR